MSFIETLYPRLSEHHETLTGDDLRTIREKLGEAALSQILINNQLGAPTERDAITGKKKSFARLNQELAQRNEQIGLHPDDANRLVVDGETDLAVLEALYPENVYNFVKK